MTHPAARRTARLRDLLEGLRLDGVLVTDPVDVRYLSGFRGDDATLVVGRAAALLCTDSRFWEQVREEVREVELSRVTTEPLLEHSAHEARRVLGSGARLGYQGAQLSHAAYRTLRRVHDGPLRHVGRPVTRLRVVKDGAEPALLRRAAAVLHEALGRIRIPVPDGNVRAVAGEKATDCRTNTRGSASHHGNLVGRTFHRNSLFPDVDVFAVVRRPASAARFTRTLRNP